MKAKLLSCDGRSIMSLLLGRKSYPASAQRKSMRLQSCNSRLDQEFWGFHDYSSRVLALVGGCPYVSRTMQTTARTHDLRSFSAAATATSATTASRHTAPAIAAGAGTTLPPISALVTCALRSFHTPGAIALEAFECRLIQLAGLRWSLTRALAPGVTSFVLSGFIIQKVFSC